MKEEVLTGERSAPGQTEYALRTTGRERETVNEYMAAASFLDSGRVITLVATPR
jgi:hypothetical protein